MKKIKPNISLINLSEIKYGGTYLALRKGANELRNIRRRKSPLTLYFPPKSYKNLLSVIICTSNCNSLVKRAVHSVLNQNFSANKFELIVVNNSDKPLELPDNIKIISEPVPGLSRARNIGATAARGEYLLYIDDDAVAKENLLLSMFSAFEKNKTSAIIGGQIFLRLPNPVPDIFLEGKEALWSAYTVPYKNFREVREQYEFPYGACFGIRHSILDILGGFPENYGRCGNNFAGGEETALCFAVLKLGLKIGINPNAAVEHCVLPERFTKEHIKKTIREGILTTYRLYKDGYSQKGWTPEYVRERINIIKKELLRTDGLAAFYKQCEYDAFAELDKIMNSKE